MHGGTPCQRSQQRRRKLACACVRSCLCVCVRVPLSSYILNIYHLLPFTVNIYSVCLRLPDCPLSLVRTLSLSLTLTLFYSPASVNAVCRLRLVLAALSIATIVTFVTTIGSKVLPLSANVIVPDNRRLRCRLRLRLRLHCRHYSPISPAPPQAISCGIASCVCCYCTVCGTSAKYLHSKKITGLTGPWCSVHHPQMLPPFRAANIESLDLAWDTRRTKADTTSYSHR